MCEVTVIDYGMGNLRSVSKAIESIGGRCEVSSNPEKLLSAPKLLLPGVGAFRDARDNLKKIGLWDAILECVQKGKPLLGICLGAQLLLEESEEGGKFSGFGFISGKVKRFPTQAGKIPHMGWNQVKIEREHPLLKGVKSGDFFYFVHSYYLDVTEEEAVITSTEYGITFASGIAVGNVAGFQFHPEKSQENGLKILKNFLEWEP